MPPEISHLPSGIHDAGADAHLAIVPFSPPPSPAHAAFESASAGQTQHDPGPMVPLKAAHMRNIDPMHLLALMMHAFGMFGGQADEGIKTAAHAAARDARELDDHLGDTHAPLLLMPPPAGEHESAAATGETAGTAAEKPEAEAPAGHAHHGHGHHDHATTSASHSQGAPTNVGTHHAQPEHEPAGSADASHAHESTDAETLSHVSAHEPDTDHAIEQQETRMQQMLEFQARMTEINTAFKIQSDMLQSLQKMTNDAADAAKYG